MASGSRTRDTTNAIAWAIVFLGWPPIAFVVGPGGETLDGLIFVAITLIWAVSPIMAVRAWVRGRGLRPSAGWRRVGTGLMVLWGLVVLALIVTQGAKLSSGMI